MVRKGLTIVELLISIAILGVIVSATITLFTTGISSYRKSTVQTEMQRDLNLTVDGIVRDTKQSILIEEDYLGAYTRDSDTLILALPAIDENENFLYDGADHLLDYVVYDLDGTDLRKKVFADASSKRASLDGKNVIILKNIDLLDFSYTPNTPGEDAVLVDIEVSISRNILGKEISFNNSSKAVKRNYE